MASHWEILVIILVIVLLLGAKKLPELARSVGRSARIFKSEIKEMKDENTQPEPSRAENSEEFWDRPENQPRQIDAPQAQDFQPGAQNFNQQAQQQPRNNQ